MRSGIYRVTGILTFYFLLSLSKTKYFYNLFKTKYVVLFKSCNVVFNGLIKLLVSINIPCGHMAFKQRGCNALIDVASALIGRSLDATCPLCFLICCKRVGTLTG